MRLNFASLYDNIKLSWANNEFQGLRKLGGTVNQSSL